LALGAVAVLGFSVGAVMLASVLAHWVALGAGVVGGGYLFSRLYQEDPLDFGEDAVGVAGYGSFSGVLGYIGFELVSRLIVSFGVAAGLAAVMLAVGVFLFGGTAVVSALVSVVELLREVLEDR